MILLPALMLAATTPLPTCQADQLSLGIDGENGAFNGMSQSGTLLVVRNIGTAACTLPGLPKLGFRDAKGRPLAITRRAPIGMHPGPVVIPVGVAPGAELTARLHWVAGPVYDHSRCDDVRSVGFTVGGTRLRTTLAAHICGDAKTGVSIDQAVLQPDPRLD